MENPGAYQFWYIYIKVGDNRMGAGSLRIVALANWANLKKLGFSNNDEK
jgi:hypothetical protein